MAIQQELRHRVETADRVDGEVRHVAGVDVAYEDTGHETVVAVVVVLDARTWETVATSSWQGRVTFPYIPGLFAFREIPPLLEAFQRLDVRPDLVVCDGSGLAHPRRCGLANHLGVLMNLPTIGCSKTHFLGDYEMPDDERGSFAPIEQDGEIIGRVLRTRSRVKPVFVSVGHRVSLATAQDWILRLTPQFRQPEPIRRANELANTLRSTLRGS